MAVLLKANEIDKHYDGVHALRGVSFEVEPGEVHALIGENGAGKSTLGKIVAGVVRADAGAIEIDGAPVDLHNPMDAQRLGIGMIFQELDLFPNLTVAENIAIGNLHLESGVRVDMKKLEAQCQPYLEQVGLHLPPHLLLGSLPIGQMQLVAIARALSMDARLIVMDEPTSALGDDAVDTLLDIIRQLKDKGVSIVYVSHKIEEIFAVCDRVTVLRDGEWISTQPTAETTPSELIRLMVGRELLGGRPPERGSPGDVLLSVRGLCTPSLADISFELRAGEALGIAGLVGAGRSEIGAALFGLDAPQDGEIIVRGRAVRPRHPAAAIGAGIGLLPEDRKLQGLMMQMSVKENASMGILRRLASAGFVRRRAELAAIGPVNARTRLKAASPDAAVSTLSGGNQQKALLAKWLLVDPAVFFLDDPTRGIDVGAKQDVYEIVDELVGKGKGVVFTSSELPEYFRCCDRILVLHEGRSMGVLDVAEATQERIMDLATGGGHG